MSKLFTDEVEDGDEMTMLVCQWLEERGFEQSLETLQRDSGKTYNASCVKMGSQLTTIYNDYLDLQVSAQLNGMTIDNESEIDDDLKFAADSTVSYPHTLEKDLTHVHSQNILALRFAAIQESTLLVSASTDKTIKVIDAATYEVLNTFVDLALAPFISLDFNPIHPNLLLASSVDGSTVLLEISNDGKDGKVLQQFKNHVKYVVRARWSPCGTKFATCSYDKTLCLYTLSNQDQWQFNMIKSFEFQFNLESLIFTPDSKKVITACRETNYLQYIDTEDFSIEKYNMNSNGDDHVSFSAMEFSITPNQKYLLVSTDRNRLILFKLHSDQQLRNFYGAFNDEFVTTRNTFNLSGNFVYSTSQDNNIYVWDISTQKIVSKLKSHTSSIRDLTIHPTLGWLASCSFDKKICLWK
ncbi:hypothetical protein DFA_03870 [Cavenderia fasciculata]|uniref:WD40 repeat-containing protein n=1 Tax=Cavenderia fasciculata TaxID=261658 RepID=F4Q0M5_CACFS|nr:uncharacterized protein DFA_03870 [Cavenderia fasciculata]EGG18376.1 hypothetical protein DFA_03870 [Cavenderia fasciculata]|eukprot:XP_004366280.1 hypothetical protein DFA_03870 [Cavenderia fasciculata]